MANRNTADAKIIRSILNEFQLERTIYLICCLASFIFLFVCAILLLVYSDNWLMALGMFGSTGVITFTTGQIFRIYTVTLDYLIKMRENSNGN